MHHRSLAHQRLRQSLGLPIVLAAALSQPGALRAQHCHGPADPTGLVAAVDATHVAVTSGSWGASGTWAGSRVPGAQARVHIPEGIAVTVRSRLGAAHRTVRVDGTLRFASGVHTELRVDTLVTTCGGLLEIGTAASPIAASATARIVFVDDGPINTAADPAQIGRGAVLRGRTVIHGAAKTHRAALAVQPQAGARSLELAVRPQGWRVGDRITITGTRPGDPRSDEIRTVSAVEGSTVTLSAPLALDHQAPAPGLQVYVANLTRNVVFASESSRVAHRGHVMFMHTLDVDVRNALFRNLGRTDKRRELDDLDFVFEEDAVGNGTSAGVVFDVVQGPRTNIRGRYPVHFHRGGVDPQSTPALIRGSVVDDSPGWGFVMHSAHVHMVDNVSYAVQGSGFYTEAGDEIGLIQGNIAVRSVNDAFVLDDEGAIDPDLGADQQEFGNDGEGFWLSGHRVALIDNVSAGSTAHGFIYWTDGLVEADIANPARMSIRVADLANGHLIPGRERIPTWWAPMAPIRGNQAYGSMIGFRFRYAYSQAYLGEGGSDFHRRPPQAYIDTLNPVIEGLTVWNNRDGVLLNYTARLSVRDARIVGIGAPTHLTDATANSGVGLDLGTDVTTGPGRVQNVTIEGFDHGLIAPRNGQWELSGLTLRNRRDLYIQETLQGQRTLLMRDVSFGSLAGTAVADQTNSRVRVTMAADLDADAFQPYYFLLPDSISINGTGLYFDQQDPSYVPLRPEEFELGDYALPYVGLSNAELHAQFGLSFGGAPTPAGFWRDAHLVGGVWGAYPAVPRQLPPLIDMTSGGEFPEPPEGGPRPRISGNSLSIRPGESVAILSSNIHALDTDSQPAQLVFSATSVRHGHFAHFTSPATPLSRFTQAEVDAGVLRFVHDGGGVAPSYRLRVSDGTSTSAESEVTVLFRNGADGGGDGDDGDGDDGDGADGQPFVCEADQRTLCLQGERFRVTVEWRDFQGQRGQGRAVSLPGVEDSGVMWFFDAGNLELLVKVLDGCGVNQNYWVFFAATTDVEFQLSVSDSVTGDTRVYRNALGQAAGAVTDTGAFATCQ